jgi:tRNA threonylcarbamoyladenosine biosynthesis protein TsaB
MILTIRTDKPVSEIGLFDGQKQLAYETWQAHRQLAETIHQKIRDLLHAQGLTLSNITGVVIYKGPGSFTGLRIGMSVANALAYGLDIPVVAAGGEDWLDKGTESLVTNSSKKPVMPEYGAQPHTTNPRK